MPVYLGPCGCANSCTVFEENATISILMPPPSQPPTFQGQVTDNRGRLVSASQVESCGMTLTFTDDGMVHIKNNLFNVTPAALMTSPTPENAPTIPPATTAEVERNEPSTLVPAVTTEEKAQSIPSLQSGSMPQGKMERITAWVEETKNWAQQVQEEIAHRPQEAAVAPVLEAAAYPAFQTSQKTNSTAVKQPSSVDSEPLPPPVPSPRYNLFDIDGQAHEMRFTPESANDYYADIVVNSQTTFHRYSLEGAVKFFRVGDSLVFNETEQDAAGRWMAKDIQVIHTEQGMEIAYGFVDGWRGDGRIRFFAPQIDRRFHSPPTLNGQSVSAHFGRTVMVRFDDASSKVLDYCLLCPQIPNVRLISRGRPQADTSQFWFLRWEEETDRRVIIHASTIRHDFNMGNASTDVITQFLAGSGPFLATLIPDIPGRSGQQVCNFRVKNIRIA